MSYTALPEAGLAPGFYQQLPAGTPGWQAAPVPGWGINPFRAGPRRIGVGQYPGPHYPVTVPRNDAVLPHYAQVGAFSLPPVGWGTVAFAAAGGIVLGLVFGWMWHEKGK